MRSRVEGTVVLTHPNFLGLHATGRCPTVVARPSHEHRFCGNGRGTGAGRVRRGTPRTLPAEAQTRYAGEDRPIEIGHGQTNSQPRTVRAMLELLDVAPGSRVLDVGCGSGWTTALLAALTGPTGSVVGLEIVPALVDLAQRNLRAVEIERPSRCGRPSRRCSGPRMNRCTTGSSSRPRPGRCPTRSSTSSRSVGGSSPPSRAR